MLRMVSSRFCVSSCLFALMVVSATSGQHRSNYPEPPPPAVREEPATQNPRVSVHRIDAVAMEREARELAALASSIPVDVEQVKRGLLPGDAVDKLKRIEKLAKQLRAQIRP